MSPLSANCHAGAMVSDAESRRSEIGRETNSGRRVFRHD
jgi:hypothetical protein